MTILDERTVVVENSSELKEVLEGNTYDLIYLGSDITLESRITFHKDRKKVTIDGTYLNVRHTYQELNPSQTVLLYVNSDHKEIHIQNMEMINSNIYGVVQAETNSSYTDIVVEYSHVNFRGVELGFIEYGTIRIMDSTIIIQNTNSIVSQEVCEARNVILGGKTTIESASSRFSIFYYLPSLENPTLTILPNSEIDITSTNRDLMEGTKNLAFQILQGASFTLTTANGFSNSYTDGAKTVLLEENASFTFLETKHICIPMWIIYDSLILKENSKLIVLNTYESTPIDNYNLFFKGESSKLLFENPKEVILYTKNANVFSTTSPLTFQIQASRVNLWSNAKDYVFAGSLEDYPEFVFENLEVEGTFTNTETISDIENFSLQNKKEFSIGKIPLNIYPIHSTSTKIEGYTVSEASLSISYQDVEDIMDADSNGYFEYTLTTPIDDSTTIQICSNYYFLYETRILITPTVGELTLLEGPTTILFLFESLSSSPFLFPKTEPTTLKIVDSRENSVGWNLMVSSSTFTSKNGFLLEEALSFLTFDGTLLTLNETPTIVYHDTSKNLTILTYSEEKGILLNLEGKSLEANEEYRAKIKWELE